MKSETHSWFGRSARNCRLTRSSGHGALLSLIVVRTTLPRITPRSPSRRISRSTVQRATAVPSRCQLPPDLVGAVDLHVGLPDALDLRHQDLVALSAGAALCRLAPQRCMAPISRRGDLQYLADRLDPVGIAMLVDEVLQDLSRRSSSAWAKNALASFRISLARRSSLTSRSEFLDALRLGGRDALAHAGIDLVALDPFQQRLRHAADLRRDRFNRRPQRRVLPSVLLHHPHRALTDLR